MRPSWVLAICLDAPLELPFDAAFVHASELSFVRASPDDAAVWSLYSTPDFAETIPPAMAARAQEELLRAFELIIGGPVRCVSALAHYWLSSLPETPLAESYLYDEALGLSVCGDWCGGPRVEGAFLSGLALAERLSQTLRGKDDSKF